MTDPHQQLYPVHHRVTGKIELLSRQAITMRVHEDSNWVRGEPPPHGWDRATPLYKATRDLHPPVLARMGLETPWATCNNAHVWQYAPGHIRSGETIATTAWPHESLHPLNESAKRIHAFFTTVAKSRLQMKPWAAGRIHLDDGMSFGDPVVKRIAERSTTAAA